MLKWGHIAMPAGNGTYCSNAVRIRIILNDNRDIRDAVHSDAFIVT
jgi:hypothetical protein